MLILLQVLFLLLCMLLVAVILVQPPKSEGFASAFGGAGTETFFGTKTSQHINRFTIILSTILLILTVLINIFISRKPGSEVPATPTSTEKPANS